MNRTFKAAVTGLILAVSIAISAAAGPFEDGTAAFQRGDYLAALRVWRPLADQGLADAQMRVGFIYVQGLGVPQDYVTAANWFRKAADQGNGEAQSLLGLMYVMGNGVPQDYVSGHQWLNLAAARGFKDAAKVRDQIALIMTPAQIAEAQSLAREWKPTPAHR